MAKKQASKKYLEKLEGDIQTNQSKVSLILGALIVLVVGILVFNFFNKPNSDLGPAQQTQIEGQDVSKDSLPGKYTVKEGDTLFTIAEKYYQDGYKFTEIAVANSLNNPDLLEAGQVIEIPKLEIAQVQATTEPSATTQPEEALGTGGGNSTIWGDRIEGSTYTVVEGDWLSTIAGRAYGDVMTFDKIAKANNISNPDLIEPGTVFTIPR